jgi:hypothetical protein
MIRSGRACRACANPSSTDRAKAIETSSPANVMAKAFWIVTLSSAIRIRFAMFTRKYHQRHRWSMRARVVNVGRKRANEA